jgi:hypothetical protein
MYGYSTLSHESVSAVTATPSVDNGTIRYHGGIEYRYMYNGGDDAYQGCPVLITASTNYTFVTTYATLTGMTAATSLGFAVVGTVHNATCAAGYYCWVAQRGLINARPCSSAIAAGDDLLIMDGGNAVSSRVGTASTATYVFITSFVMDAKVGQAMEAATAAATGVIKVYRA